MTPSRVRSNSIPDRRLTSDRRARLPAGKQRGRGSGRQDLKQQNHDPSPLVRVLKQLPDRLDLDEHDARVGRARTLGEHAQDLHPVVARHPFDGEFIAWPG